jgi:hypothetical protein
MYKGFPINITRGIGASIVLVLYDDFTNYVKKVNHWLTELNNKILNNC